MTADEYIRTQVRIFGIGSTLSQIDLDGFINDARKAEASGAVIDPTLYARGIESLVAIRKFAESLNDVKRQFEETRSQVLANAFGAKE